MIRTTIRTILVMIVPLAIPAMIFGTALPASATNNKLCERNDPTVYCLSAASSSLYTAITEGDPGRDLAEVPLNGTFENAPTYLLQFTTHTADCVGVANDIAGGVEIKPCDGGTGVVWARVPDGTNTYLWINQYATLNNDQGQILYLSGLGNGSQYEVLPHPSTGWYQAFIFS